MIYFDNAATSFPKPPQVANAVSEAITVYGGNPGRGGCPPSSVTGERIYSVREGVNEFFNGYGAEYAVFTSNATAALNLAIFGTFFAKNKRHFVVTAFEHNSVLRPLEEIKTRFGGSFTVVPPSLESDELSASRILSAVRRDTAAVIMTHASNVCGRILPVETVGRALKNSGITFIVDASQTAGVRGIDMRQSGIDILCTAGHKGLLGPTGTGLMLISPGLSLAPTVFGGTGSNSNELTQPNNPPERYESGTVNVVGIIGLDAGINAVRASSELIKNERLLADRLYRGLFCINGVRIYARYDDLHYVPTVSFNIKDMPSYDVSEALAERGIATRAGLHCAPLAHGFFGTRGSGTVRASLGIYNDPTEVDAFLNAVEDIAQKNR